MARRARGPDLQKRKKRRTKSYPKDTKWNVVNTRTHKQVNLDPKYARYKVFTQPGPKKVVRRNTHAHRYHTYSKNYGKTHYRADILSSKNRKEYNKRIRIAKSGR
jgi:hypothetical protein